MATENDLHLEQKYKSPNKPFSPPHFACINCLLCRCCKTEGEQTAAGADKRFTVWCSAASPPETQGEEA